jgi:hypothetical protein
LKADDNQITLYQAPDGALSLEVRLQHETVWLSAHQMARLFGRDRTVIVRHIHNIYATEELLQEATCAKNAQVAADGRIREMDLYNLDMIISVGYRVNSKRGTQFRIWATSVLREHILKGYTVNENRLRQLNQTIRLIADIANRRVLTGDEATALPRVVADYYYARDLLDSLYRGYPCRSASEVTTNESPAGRVAAVSDGPAPGAGLFCSPDRPPAPGFGVPPLRRSRAAGIPAEAGTPNGAAATELS